MKSLITSTYNQLDNWIDKNGPMSYDVSDIKAQAIYIWIINFSQKSKFTKILTAPAILLAENYTNFLRKVFIIKKKIYPQGQAVLARAYLAHYKLSKNKDSLDKALKALDWLKQNPSIGYNKYCWGQPYNWYSRKLIPANIPRATVTSQVANAFLDAYEVIKEEEYLEIAIEACNFFIENLKWQEDEDGFICFSYTSVDNYNIHNASMLAAAVLIRTWFYSKIGKFKEFGIKAMNFTIKHQNEDGSWFYWAPPDKIIGKIDNYHTGFVLESLEVIKKYTVGGFDLDHTINKGLEFYLKNLFVDNSIPKMTNKSIYPIDIQSCAQAIITLGEMKSGNPVLEKIANEIAKWTIENMIDEKGFFYFRIYKNGRIDKTPYIRWSESWMLRALTFLLDKNPDTNENI
ncbi:MAG TPA: hypothetical protein DCG75_18935 [Bacteroidales bacterium]|nr:hypothetical protein [Bacteroidales bacterium]